MLLNTDLMVDFLRGHPPAVAWVTALPSLIGLSGLVAMELIRGCWNRLEQKRVERELQRFPLFWPTLANCRRAYQDFAVYLLSHGLGILDAFIAHTAVGRNESLATFNVKHFRLIRGLRTSQPY